MDANIDGLRHILDHCVRRRDSGSATEPVEHVLFFSSSYYRILLRGRPGELTDLDEGLERSLVWYAEHRMAEEA